MIHNPGLFQITLKLFLWSPELPASSAEVPDSNDLINSANSGNSSATGTKSQSESMDTESHPGTTRSNIAGSSGKAGKTTDLPTDSFSSSASPGYYLVLEDAATGQGDLPGGRINKDEIHRPFTENLAREVQEELGSLRYRLYPEPIFVFPHFVAKDQTDALGIAYVGELLGGSPTLSEEHNRYFWSVLNDPVPEIFVDTMRSAVGSFLNRKTDFLNRLKATNLITLP